MDKGLYLGKEFDPATGNLGAPVLLDPADLLTHGLIVGMTGSGKTGQAIVLIEEALRRGVPVLAIDPKGDLGNLLLLFEDQGAASFAEWVDRDAARREGKDAATAGAEAAQAWKKGLAEWGLSGSDIAELRRSHEATIYTPGSAAGVGLNVMQSLAAPEVPFESAEEDLRDEIAGIVSGLLGLLRIPADPLQSREYILLSTLIEHAWRQGKGLTLDSLVPAVADPPFDKIGALPLESVYPRRERQGLMMALNNLLASPSFEAWREGEPLDVERLLRAGDGRPRLSIVYTAHLADEERLFVTALLLDKVKTWMRRQGGTSELRALVYMDEIFGYFPPHPQNPPPKRPLLTLLKQARAQGVGVVLATQNPVDLDYKGLANMGTWFVGKLQTDQDRARLRDGLLDAGMDPGTLEKLLAATRKRVFLLHDVHRAKPCLLHSRWAMSYLRGPLTRDEISRLMEGRKAAAAQTTPATTERARAEATPAGPPVLPPPLRHAFLARHGGDLASSYLLVKYAVRRKGAGEAVESRAWPLAGRSMAEDLEAEPIAVDEAQVSAEPPQALRYGELPSYVASGARGIEKALKDRLPDKLAVTLWLDPVTKAVSRPGEPREAFAARLGQESSGPQQARLREKLDKKRHDLATAEQDLAGRKREKWVAWGSAILSNIGLITGRKRTISNVPTAMGKQRMEDTAESRVEALKAEVAALESEMASLAGVDADRLQEKQVVPARGDLDLLRYDVLWVY
jgi:Helicase HerA, central domain